ncbi:FMN-dependent NADH-azoreductase [Nonomuraea soli]|uniref:FMN-dependent NADH-azoreductase n=1 Tax=Nonomuraea soli TaxID=1032476 RepID=A0A7W0CSK3_9ACTN|nr:NAD(P)H-dependent oxidoreductase [Nonomuraea soli]MBA2896556.1 FMN-dependent NADH-azoreductase [Nonomuraea soli]
MTLFRVDASILPGSSASSELADLVEAQWSAARPGDPVVRRHLGTDPLPSDAWASATTAGFVPEPDRTPAQRQALDLAAGLASELAEADAVLLAVPLYNYGVAQNFKSWIDLVITGAGAGVPVLKGKPTVLATVRGGGYGPGTPKEGWDHSTPYLRRILADLWEADLTVVERELTLVGVNPALDGLRDLAADVHAEARRAAHEAGRSLAALPLAA